MVEGDGIETMRGVIFPWHCDMMGHCSVQHQLPLLDNAVYHLLGEFGPAVALVDGQRRGWADVRHEIEYRHELVAGDLVILRSGIIRIGASSIRHRTSLSRRSDGAACTVMTATTVRFDLDARRSVPLSDAERAIAERMLIQEGRD